ncbi:hypothetical protein pb186bvf_012063 [Paramecium bursaria]
MYIIIQIEGQRCINLDEDQFFSLIDIVRNDVDEDASDVLVKGILERSQNKLQLLDQLIVPNAQFKKQTIEIIEKQLQGEDYLCLSVYGKLASFKNYSNKVLLHNLLDNFLKNLKSLSIEQVASAAIGLGLSNFKEKEIWDQIANKALEVQKDFHSYMRITTAMNLCNYENPILWNDFLKQFLCEIDHLSEDVATQSLMVISHQNIIVNEQQQSKLEQFFISKSQHYLAENQISVYNSFARLKIGGANFYQKLNADVIELKGDDYGLFMVDILKIKDRIPEHTLQRLITIL